jgi:diamine N-acetyltransferase
MIDKSEQGKGYGQAALQEIIRYFKENGVDTVYLSTAPANARGLHVYHKAGFKETGEIEDGEAIFVLKL